MDLRQHEFWIAVNETSDRSDTQSYVALLQADLGIIFPRSFVQIHENGLRQIHGIFSDAGTLENCDLHALSEPEPDSYRSDITSARRNMLDHLEASKGWFEKVVPFGKNGAGSQFCFDFNKGSDPFITKLDWDYHVLARSFDELLLRSSDAAVVPIAKDEVFHFLEGLPAKW
jgi:hypothetical protein